jgi:hypothetical protein
MGLTSQHLGHLPQIDWVDMQDDLDDFESPYFDWDNDRVAPSSLMSLNLHLLVVPILSAPPIGFPG